MAPAEFDRKFYRPSGPFEGKYAPRTQRAQLILRGPTGNGGDLSFPGEADR